MRHDDALRAFIASGDQPVALTPTIVNRARALQAPHLTFGGPRRLEQRVHTAQASGAMKRFLDHARIVQNLPSFGRSMRE
jgi:hypothetical protein